MSSSICLLNSKECPCPGTHYAACTEFIEGFQEFGFTTTVATCVNECKGKSVILLSSHEINIAYLNILNTANPDAIYILWYYHSVYDSIPFKYFILTGEHFFQSPKCASHIPYHTLNISISNFVPLLLRVNESPELIGKYSKDRIYDGCFMGTPYKQHWVYNKQNIVYHNISTNGLLSYTQRREIYLQSKIAFGFHNDGNILNSHVTQRVFEGLAYGCVVISDNKAASDMTDGIVEYAENKEQFDTIFQNMLNNSELINKKRELGYEWVKKYGTNRYAASLFLIKIKELWNISFAP
jgi:hypothetical protein